MDTKQQLFDEKKPTLRPLRQKGLLKRISTLILDPEPPKSLSLEIVPVDLHHGEDPSGKLEFTYLVHGDEILEIENVYLVRGIFITAPQEYLLYNLILKGVKIIAKIGMNAKVPSYCDLIIVDTKAVRYIVSIEIDVEMEGYCKEYKELTKNLNNKELPSDLHGFTTMDRTDKKIVLAAFKY